LHRLCRLLRRFFRLFDEHDHGRAAQLAEARNHLGLAGPQSL
jgi:hypothetical protein